MTLPIKIIDKDRYEKEFEKPNQEQVWDSISVPWKTYVVKKIPIVEEFLKNKKGLVVDLGCGNGRNFIENKNIKYYGVDFSNKQLEHSKKAIEKEKINVKLFKFKINELDGKVFKNNMFDYGLFIGALHCLETNKERRKAVAEFYRILKPNAEALISVWDKTDNRFKGKSSEVYMSWKENNIPYFRYYYLYDKDELIKLLKSAGFKILEVYEKREHDRFSRKNLVIRIKKR